MFVQPPICSTRRGPNLASHLLRAKLQKLPLSLTRAATGDRVVGVRKCGVGGRRQSCPLCPHLGHAANNPRAVIQEVTIYHSGAVITINQNLKCTDYGVIYLLSCTKPLCRKQYIGETGRPAYVRFKEHLDSAEDPGTTTPVGQHFQSAGHSKTDMVMIPFEKVKGDRATRQQRERFFINNNNLITHGLNLNL